MRFGALALIGIVALAASGDAASARDGCGRGLAWNGYACVPYQAPRPAPDGGCYGPTGVYDPRGCGASVPYQAPRPAPGGGCYGPTGIYDPRGCRASVPYQAPRPARGGGCYGPTGVYDPRGC